MGYVKKPTAAQKELARNKVFNASFRNAFRNGMKFSLEGVSLREEESVKKNEKKVFIFWVIKTSLGDQFDLTLGLVYNTVNLVCDCESNRNSKEASPFLLFPIGEMLANVPNSLAKQAEELAVNKAVNDVEKLFSTLVENNKGKTFVVRNRRSIKVENSFAERPFTSIICDFVEA